MTEYALGGNPNLSHNSSLSLACSINQSVENAGVAFVKGANERNEFFKKINKQ